MAVPTTKPLPIPPNRTSGAGEFTPRADIFFGAMPQFQTDMNTLATYSGQQATAAEAAKVAAEAARNAAAGSATTATQQVTQAQQQVALAASQRQAAEAAAAAAGAAIGLPSMVGKQRQPLRARADEQGVEFASTLSLVACLELTRLYPAATGSVVIDLAQASLFDLSMTGNVSLTIANPPVFSGETLSIVVRIRQPSVAYSLAWFSGITWLAASTPATPAANKIVEYILSTTDGVSWLGRRGASN